MTNIVVVKSTDNAEPLSICFYLKNQRQRKFFLEKRKLRDMLSRAELFRHIIDNGELANQMARLRAIVVKYKSHHFIPCNKCNWTPSAVWSSRQLFCGQHGKVCKLSFKTPELLSSPTLTQNVLLSFWNSILLQIFQLAFKSQNLKRAPMVSTVWRS